MITYHDGDLLESSCDIIAHQVNEYGVMGAGIAAQIKDKYPNIYDAYHFIVESGSRIDGVVYPVKVENSDRIVVNCFTQRNGKTDYKALKEAVIQVKVIAKIYAAKTVGIPYKYGCGIAYGDWDIVEKIWTDAFADSPIELQIWKLK